MLWGQEADSPRGRIYLMRMRDDGDAEITGNWVEHFDTCLGCMACMTACPSGVDYAKLIEATRATIERQHCRSIGERVQRRLIFALFPRPDRLRRLLPFLALYQRSGLQRLVRSGPMRKLVPGRMAAMEALLPPIGPRQVVPPTTPAVGERRTRVGLLLGCVQRELLSEVNAATARVLAAEGCEVVAPPEQPCCGALMVHAGEESAAQDRARHMIDTFDALGVERIIVNAGGCGSSMKEYGHVLRNDPVYADRARTFAAKCRDVAEFMVEIGPVAPRHALAGRVAYHDSCHLQHAQGIRGQPRALLAGIPGLEVMDVPEGVICCGSAGIYNLVQPRTATELGDRKASLIDSLHPDVVATGNPGCILQLGSALSRRGVPIPVVHTIQLVDASIRGVSLQGVGGLRVDAE